MFRKFLTTTTILVLLFAAVASAQVGKIIGKIVDKETGQPLIGANVLVVGTNFGAATDVNGEYIIANIAPGTYSVRASYIGYQNVTIENIRISANLSTTVDFQLPTTALATNEVVIVSERPLIQKSATNAIRIVNAEDLEDLPVRSINSVIGLQAGVVQQNGVTFVRGSRGNETGYRVEGASTKNVVSTNGGNLVTIIPDAVQELTVQAGGVSAEYGGANAGVVSEDFKSGTNDYRFSLRAETDNFGNYPSDKFLGTYSYGYYDYVATISGPLLTDKLKVFIAVQNQFDRESSPKFFDPNPRAYSDGALFDTTKVYDSGALGGSTSDYQILSWGGGSVLGKFQNLYALNGTATLDLKPLIVRFSGSYDYSLTRNNSNDISNYFDLARLGLTDRTGLLLNLKGTYLLNSSSYVEATVSMLDRRTEAYDPDLGRNYLSYNDSLVAALHGWQYRGPVTGPANYDFYGFPFARPGALLTGYGKSHWTNFEGSVALTAQLDKHEIKAGASYQRWTIRNYGVGGSSTLLNDLRNNPDIARNPDVMNIYMSGNQYRLFNNYGFDFYGREIDDEFGEQFAPKHPVFSSGYVQDKIEIKDIIINAGLRFDYINMDSWAIPDPANPVYDDNTKLIPNLQKGRTFSYLSPKLGFSFPVTDRTVFHMQYGKYVQAPGLATAYRGITSSTQILIGGNAFTNPISYDPEPIRTTQYEIGFTQQFSDFAAFDLTAFYKDITGQLQYAWQLTSAGSQIAKYPVYTNQDFATTKGLEVSLNIRRTNRIRASINYTYSDAKGTNSFAGSGFGSIQVNSVVPTVIQALSYDQTHRGSIVLDYRFGKDDGGPILEQLGVNFLFTFNSGHPYTLAQPQGLGQNSAWTGGLVGTDTRFRVPNGPVNGSVTPWNYQLDMRIDKNVTIMNVNVDFYVYAQNLLNTKNVINVYDNTGNAYDDGFLGTLDAQKIIAQPRYTQRFADLYQALNLDNREHSFAQKGTDVFGTPRLLRAGILINF